MQHYSETFLKHIIYVNFSIKILNIWIKITFFDYLNFEELIGTEDINKYIIHK